MRTTRTFVTLEVSKAAYEEIAAKLREAEYPAILLDDGREALDMHGIALCLPQPKLCVECGKGIEVRDKYRYREDGLPQHRNCDHPERYG